MVGSVAAVLIISDYARGILTLSESTPKQLLDDLFLYLGKAVTIVGGVMTAARFWIFADRHLPERIQERIAQWQSESTERRQELLAAIDQKWSAAPLKSQGASNNASERAVSDRMRELTSAAEQAINATSREIAELKSALSQKSFAEASIHFAHGVEFLKLADGGIGEPARVRAIEALKEAVRLESDVAPNRKEIAIHKLYFRALEHSNLREEAIQAIEGWRSVADGRSEKREMGECRIALGDLLLQKARNANFQYERDSIASEALVELQEAIELFDAQPISPDTGRARAHELSGDAMKELRRAQASWESHYDKAIRIFRAAKDSQSVTRVKDKRAETDDTITNYSQAVALVIAREAFANALYAEGKTVDAQSHLWNALRSAQELRTPTDISDVDKEDLLLRIRTVLKQMA